LMENLWIFEQLEEFLDTRIEWVVWWRIFGQRNSRIQQFDASSNYGSFSSGSNLQSLSVFNGFWYPILFQEGIGDQTTWDQGTYKIKNIKLAQSWCAREQHSFDSREKGGIFSQEDSCTGNLQSSVRNWESSLFLLVQPRYKNLVLFVTLVAKFFIIMAFV
jgi:hypothetical protein